MENEMQTMPTQGHGGALIGASSIFTDAGLFSRIDAVAEMMSKGKTSAPDHLKGQKGDCFAVCEQAYRWGISPFAVAPKTYFIKGVIAYEAQLVNAVIISSGVLACRPRYEYVGDWSAIIGKTTSHGSKEENGLGVTVFVTFKGESFERSYTAYLSECPTRNSPNWKYKQKLQISYVAIRELTRQQAPDVLMGVYTEDEFETQPPRIINQGAAHLPDISSEKQPANQGSSPDKFLENVLNRIAGAKSNAELEKVKIDINMMKGVSKRSAIDAYRAKESSLTIQSEVIHKKSFAEIEDQINASPSSAPDFVTPELIAHLPADQQVAITKLANTAFDKSMK